MTKPSVFVDIKGGLGNQLFQIATAYAYARQQDGELKILKKGHNGNRPVYWNTVLSRTRPFWINMVPHGLATWSEQLPTMYTEPPPLPSQGIHLNGYLQSSKYFVSEMIRNEIRQLFQPTDSLVAQVMEQYPLLHKHRSRVVVMHARRTDYEHFATYHGPLKGIYYQRAVQRIRQRVPNAFFLLSSDDSNFWQTIHEWIPDVFSGEHYILQNSSDIDTFVLLQQFDHFILSNSTFIWWCAFLSKGVMNVIAPEQWFGPQGPHPFHDIYEGSWDVICSE